MSVVLFEGSASSWGMHPLFVQLLFNLCLQQGVQWKGKLAAGEKINLCILVLCSIASFFYPKFILHPKVLASTLCYLSLCISYGVHCTYLLFLAFWMRHKPSVMSCNNISKSVYRKNIGIWMFALNKVIVHCCISWLYVFHVQDIISK